MMKVKELIEKWLIKRASFFCSVICISLIAATNTSVASDRFEPPKLNAALDDFNKRFDSSGVNIDFIVAQVLNNARQIERAGDAFKKNAALFNNQTNSTNTGAVSNSVIIPPGTTANTIIVINQNDGNSYAIQR